MKTDSCQLFLRKRKRPELLCSIPQRSFCAECNSWGIYIMLGLFDTGRMAKKFGKWRGPITVVCGVVVCIFAVMVSRLADVVSNLDSTPVDASSVAMAAMVIYGAGVLLGIWGAYQFIMDAMRSAYIEDADRYDRSRM